MNSEQDIIRLGVAGTSNAFAESVISPPDALSIFYDRIKRLNPQLNAFLALRMDAAFEEARASGERWRRGEPLSPIDGVPFGAKANIAVAGLPWHAGIGAYQNQIAEKNAASVENLVLGGAIPIGILNMHEGALGATTDNQVFGKCRNPWRHDLTPGGSSGGPAAAVAAGLCAFALGTDTMGSVRIPAAYCGGCGHKPSYGGVPAGGLIDLSPTLDHIGSHTLYAEDLAIIFPVLAGGGFQTSTADLRIGVANWTQAVETSREVAAAYDQSTPYIAQNGSLHEIDITGLDFSGLRCRALLISEVEGHRTHEKQLSSSPQGFSQEFRHLLEWGADQPVSKVEAAYAEIKRAAAVFDKIFDDVDVLVAPTTPQGPFPFGDEIPANQADLTCMANISGSPAVAVPAKDHQKPPASLQFMSRKGRDDVALAAAIAFEKARGRSVYSPLLNS